MAKILAKTRVLKLLKKIEDIISIMVTYYSDELKQILDVNDPSAIKGLNTHEDLIVKFPLISVEYLLLNDNRIGAETLVYWILYFL